MKKLHLIILLLVSVFNYCHGQISPFNNLNVELNSGKNYHFYVSGHFHGSGTNHTGYPINSLLANINELNNSNASFLVCLGDLFLDISNDIPFYQKSFFKKLTIPLFNTVGNHDLTDDIYQNNFGETDFQFTVNRDRHLFFDTESENGSFSQEQLSILESTYEAVKSRTIRRVFIYCHRTIWAKHYQAINGLFADNTQAVLGNNFSKSIYPLLKNIANEVPVQWYSGSIGSAPASFFYHEDEETDVTYIATAIRGLKRDAWLKVFVSESGDVNFETISLTGQDLKKLKEYDVDFWNTTSAKQPFNYKLVPYYIKLVLLHRAFWYGVITTVTVVILVFRFIRIRRKKKLPQ